MKIHETQNAHAETPGPSLVPGEKKNTRNPLSPKATPKGPEPEP